MARLRLALAGCGSHAETAHAMPLARFARQNPDLVELAAACDVLRGRAERFCREYGFGEAYSVLEEMLDAENPDAVVSVVPIDTIAEIGGELLRRGIPCVLEKPAGGSLGEAQALAQVARETGTPHMVSMNRRFNPFLNRAAEWAGERGPLRHIHGQMVRHARFEPEFPWGTGVHIVDAMRYLGGEIAGAKVERLEGSELSAPWFLVRLQYRTGCTGSLEILPTAGVVDEVYELFGDGLRARVHTMGAHGESARCWRNGMLEVESIANEDDPAFLRDGSYEETSAFLRALLDAAPLVPTLEDVLPSLEVCARLSSL